MNHRVWCEAGGLTLIRVAGQEFEKGFMQLMSHFLRDCEGSFVPVSLAGLGRIAASRRGAPPKIAKVTSH